MNYSNCNGLPAYSPDHRRCNRCHGQLSINEKIAYTGKEEYWHLECFVCSQCFRPFSEINYEYYEIKDRKYCIKDFKTLFAPFCYACNELIVNSRIIRYKNNSWHPDCLKCDDCKRSIKMIGPNFIKSESKTLTCFQCNKESLSLVVNSFDEESELDFSSSDVEL